MSRVKGAFAAILVVGLLLATAVHAEPADKSLTNISYGALVSGVVSVATEVDTFVFTGQSGDIVFIRINRTSGGVNPKLRLYNPSGTLITTANPIPYNYNRAEIVDIKLLTSGNYSLLVTDDNGAQTGGYYLKLESITRPGQQDTLVYGELVVDSIPALTEMDVYRFAGLAGEKVLLRMNRTSGSLEPTMRLYGPNDSLVTLANPVAYYANRCEIIDFVLPASGTYTLFALDVDGFQTGGYGLTVESVPRPGQPDTLAYGELSQDTISAVTAIDVYRFAGLTGEKIWLRMNRTSGSVNPSLRLYGPNDSVVTLANPVAYYANRCEIIDFVLPASGTYTLFALDDDGFNTGGYNLRLQCRQDIRAKADTLVLNSGRQGSLSALGDMFGYVFLAPVATTVTIRLTRLSGSFEPLVELADASDDLIASVSGTSEATIAGLVIPGGWYTIFVSDVDGDEAGNYEIYLNPPPSLIDNSIVRVHLDHSRGMVDSLTYKLGSNKELLDQSWNNSNGRGLGRQLGESNSFCASWSLAPDSAVFVYQNSAYGSKQFNLRWSAGEGFEMDCTFEVTKAGSLSEGADWEPGGDNAKPHDSLRIILPDGSKVQMLIHYPGGYQQLFAGYAVGVGIWDSRYDEAIGYRDIPEQWIVCGTGSSMDGPFHQFNGPDTLTFEFAVKDTGSFWSWAHGYVHNVGVTAILSPKGVIPKDTTVIPEATVKNYGDSTETFPVVFRVGRVYSDNVSVTLASRQIDTVSFRSWQPSEAATYDVSCAVDMDGDQSANDDTVKSIVAVSSGSGPEIHRIVPSFGIADQVTTVTLFGVRFTHGMSARLSLVGEQDIVADSSHVVVVNDTTARATFNLSGVVIDCWDLIVTAPTGESYRYYKAFNVIIYAGTLLPFCQWVDFTVHDGSTIEIGGVNVPKANDVFMLLEKSNQIGYSGTWFGTVTLKVPDGTVAGEWRSGDDVAYQVHNPTSGFYTLQIKADDPGEGQVMFCSSLPIDTLGKWRIGEILRPYGTDWVQFDVPAGQDTLYVQTEGYGMWSTIDVYYENLSTPTKHWQFSNMGAGYHIAGKIVNPPAGRYYLKYMDSAVLTGTSSQVRQYVLFVDIHPIVIPPPTRPTITGLSTYVGGQGPVTVTVMGSGLDSAANISLVRAGFASITAARVKGDSAGLALNASFNLAFTELGDWNLVVTNPGGAADTAVSSFSVQSTKEPDLVVEVLGREEMRIGRWQTQVFTVRNPGNVDAVDYLLSIRLPRNILSRDNLPYLDPSLDWTHVPQSVVIVAERVIPIWIYKIPAGSSASFTVDLLAQVAQGASSMASNLAESERQEEFSVVTEIRRTTRTRFSQTDGDFTYFEESQTYQICRDGVCEALRRGGVTSDPAEVGREVQRSAMIGVAEGLVMTIFGIIGEAACAAAGPAWLPCFTVMTGLAVVGGVSAFQGVVDLIGTAFSGSSNRNLVGSVTPEDKYGPGGFDLPSTPPDSLSRYVQRQRSLDYRIDFWNHDTATAPAQIVFVEDILDADFDVRSFGFKDFGFLRWSIALGGGQYFNVNVDMRPDMNLIVNAQGTFDPDHRAVRWAFRSLDPVTGLPPEDPMVGFLPPIDSLGYNIGWVDFSVDPLPDLLSGTKLTNQAWVNFDSVGGYNPAPKERPYLNTIDASAPSSHVAALPGTSHRLRLDISWSGADDSGGSGLASYTIYYSVDSGPFVPWITNTTSTRDSLPGEDHHTYSFYSVARDNVGHVESLPITPDATTYIDRLCGDVDGEGTINIADVVYLIAYIFSSGPAPVPLLAGDANCDGDINIADCVYLINYIFSHGAAPCGEGCK